LRLLFLLLLLSCVPKSNPDCERGSDIRFLGTEYELYYCNRDMSHKQLVCIDDGSGVYECYKKVELK
jgi:hypothetical protein